MTMLLNVGAVKKHSPKVLHQKILNRSTTNLTDLAYFNTSKLPDVCQESSLSLDWLV
jgi:hypothetical protein